MSTTFENELRKIFDNMDNLRDVKYVGRACYASIGKELKLKTEFVNISMSSTHYDAVRCRVINRTDGEVDVNTIRLKDLWGIKKIPNNPSFSRDGVSPHMWICDNELEWYAYQPTKEDFAELSDSIKEYTEVFQEQSEEQGMDGIQM